MKYYKYLLLAAAAILLLGCDSGASFTVINKSNYPVYASIAKHAEVTIPGNSERTWDFDTDTQYIFGGEVKKKVQVSLKGDSYLMYLDETMQEYVDTTYIYLKAGEKRKAFIWPNRASIKIQNLSSQKMIKADIIRHDGVTPQLVSAFGELEPGQSEYRNLAFATASTSFYYYVDVYMEDDSEYTFGDHTNILKLDEQFLITLADPERSASALTATYLK